MRIITKDRNIILEGVRDFNITQTLECGQCFHFDKINEGEYGVVNGNKLLHIKQDKDKIICFDTNKEIFRENWLKYFDLERDYDTIKKYLINADSRLEDAINTNYGVRILNQDFTETLMSFIISQNKQIPHIKKIVKEISKKYGRYLGNIGDIEFYSYPDKTELQHITEEDYRECKTGFRAAYLKSASERILGDDMFTDDVLKNMTYEEAKSELIKIKGVGEKVANCVLLFSLGFRNAFPVDVWIKRIMEFMYFEKDVSNDEIMKLAKEKYGMYGGYAQQYLFYYARENGLGR